MAENNGEKPMTVKDFQEVIIPAMEGVFATKKDLENFATKKDLENFATKKDLEIVRFSLQADMKENFVNKAEFAQFRNESFNFFDKIVKDLDILMTEQKMGYYQKQKERSLWTIMIEAMKEHQILSNEQVQKIKELGVF
ncbi:MAG: hypothetical protein AAB723_03140 [Patescibacteria group bacterium]